MAKKINHGNQIAQIRKNMIGLSYSWIDDKVVQFLNDGNNANEYKISPRSIRFDHKEKSKKLYARQIFMMANGMARSVLDFKWSIDIDAQFKNNEGIIWAFNEEFAATATLDAISSEVNRVFEDAIKMAEQVSKGKLGQLTFKQAKFIVRCEA